MDVSSLYTNIDTDEGLTIVQEQIGKTNQNKPSSKTLSCLLDEVLKVSNFSFRNEQYIQIKGTDVGLRVIIVAPVCKRIHEGLGERFVYQTMWANHVIIWARFIDDIFLIGKVIKAVVT